MKELGLSHGSPAFQFDGTDSDTWLRSTVRVVHGPATGARRGAGTPVSVTVPQPAVPTSTSAAAHGVNERGAIGLRVTWVTDVCPRSTSRAHTNSAATMTTNATTAKTVQFVFDGPTRLIAALPRSDAVAGAPATLTLPRVQPAHHGTAAGQNLE